MYKGSRPREEDKELEEEEELLELPNVREPVPNVVVE